MSKNKNIPDIVLKSMDIKLSEEEKSKIREDVEDEVLRVKDYIDDVNYKLYNKPKNNFKKYLYLSLRVSSFLGLILTLTLLKLPSLVQSLLVLAIILRVFSFDYSLLNIKSNKE